MNLPLFYRFYRILFENKLSQEQVDGFDFLLTQMESDDRWGSIEDKAYALATVYHETAKTIQPIREYGKGKGRKYGRPDPQTGQTYYGRGYVQLTWKYNYDKARQALEVDFVAKPDLVMEPRYAYEIMVRGMTEGWFTGKKLSDYPFYRNKRRVINGMDRAALIAGYADKFEILLRAAR